jgi:hypothetical protein
MRAENRLMALPTMLFVRHVTAPTGGHIQVCNYMHHVRASGRFEPVLYLTQNSAPGALARWLPKDIRRVPLPFEADAFFLGGMDWSLLDRARMRTAGKPVLNILQGLRHARSGDPRTRFLGRHALRVCVSPEVASAVTATGLARGPIVTVPLGLAMPELYDLRTDQPERRVFIGGMKQARPDSPVNPGAIARGLAQVLEGRGIAVHLQARWVERGIFLRHMAQSMISVLLPVDDEGFFIPPLEAMAMGSAVAVPDAGGNRSFCLDGETCLMPPYTVEGLAEAASRLWQDGDLRSRLREGGFAMAQRHTLKQERASFVAEMNRYVEAAEFG